MRIDSGQHHSVPAVARQLVDDLAGVDHDVFTCDSHGITEEGPVPAALAIDDGLWNGPPQHGVVLWGTLAEWSSASIGWLAEVVADCVSRLGVDVPVLFTVTRV